MTTTYSISELASEFGVTTRTIRFYEEKGLLNPRREGTKRIYDQADRTRLRLVLRGKRLGISLDESAEIVLMYDSKGNNKKQLEKLLSTLREKRASLEHQRTDLELMLQELQKAESVCLEALSGPGINRNSGRD